MQFLVQLVTATNARSACNCCTSDG